MCKTFDKCKDWLIDKPKEFFLKFKISNENFEQKILQCEGLLSEKDKRIKNLLDENRLLLDEKRQIEDELNNTNKNLEELKKKSLLEKYSFFLVRFIQEFLGLSCRLRETNAEQNQQEEFLRLKENIERLSKDLTGYLEDNCLECEYEFIETNGHFVTISQKGLKKAQVELPAIIRERDQIIVKGKVLVPYEEAERQLSSQKDDNDRINTKQFNRNTLSEFNEMFS